MKREMTPLERDLGITWTHAKPKDPIAAMREDLEITESSEAETHRYNLEQQKILEEQAEREAKEMAKLDGLNADEVLALWEKEEAKRAAKTRDELQFDAARTFCAEQAGFIQNQKNAEIMGAWLAENGLSGTEPDHFHRAYAALAPRGVIKTQKIIKPRPEEARKPFTQAELESMPIEQLYELAWLEEQSR